jgi:hypothetical protein
MGAGSNDIGIVRTQVLPLIPKDDDGVSGKRKSESVIVVVVQGFNIDFHVGARGGVVIIYRFVVGLISLTNRGRPVIAGGTCQGAIALENGKGFRGCVVLLCLNGLGRGTFKDECGYTVWSCWAIILEMLFYVGMKITTVYDLRSFCELQKSLKAILA